MKTLKCVFLFCILHSAFCIPPCHGQSGTKITDFPNTGTLQPSDLFFMDRPGSGGFNVRQDQMNGAIGAQPASGNLTLWSAFPPNTYSNNFDLAGTGPASATAATNAIGVSSQLSAFAPTNQFVGEARFEIYTNSIGGGSGNVTGAASSTNLEVALFNGTTGKAIFGSGHLLSDFALNSVLASGSQNGLLSSADWTTLNSKMDFTTTSNLILNMTLPIDSLATNNQINLFGVGSSTNAIPVHLGSNMSFTTNGDGTLNLNSTATGGGGTATNIFLARSNFFNINTNPVVIDLQLLQAMNINAETNIGTLIFSNAWNLTNFHDQSFTLTVHQPTNGNCTVAPILVDKGILKTNTGNWFGTGTNEEDQARISMLGSGTNLFVSVNTNLLPPTFFTNSLVGGGGGGGGSSPFITAFPADGTATMASGNDKVGFKLTVGAANIIVTDLGFRVNSGNTGVHTLEIYDNSAILVVSTTVDLTGQSAGTVVYSAITPTTLTAGSNYYVVIDMTTGETFQLDTSTVTTTSDATVIDSAYHDGSGFHVLTPGAHCYGIPNLKYHL